ncbi:excalibur calcium-binding domain-containing protein [Rothia mucilaginosa]|uniref:excalibur calcium-binding domain-containing protein n=1 Tax=Rothia mucilaginosa TaxID=43675 RepID=UPI001C5A4FEC|nr:excalibur calcium-binding domain-containing protein [Rothia mucilaginosa]QXW98403.1 excalibur calcium-binding domain-containing protein [Rothia mucilaginosa]
MLKIHTATAGVLAGALLLTGCSSSIRAPKVTPSASSSSTSASASASVSATPSSSPTPSASATPSESPSPTVTPSPVPTTEAPAQAPAAEAPSAQAPAAEAPAQQAPAQPVQQAPAQSSVYYKNCAAAIAAGAAPLHRGEPGYRPGLDSDGDGVACEPKKKR